MARRYLTRDEVQGALRRGKAVECFLGSCFRGDVAGIRRASIHLVGDVIELSVFETADLGSAQFVDLYEFEPLNPDLLLDEADDVSVFASLNECLDSMEARWPGSAQRLTNEGVVQDEYGDYLANGRR